MTRKEWRAALVGIAFGIFVYDIAQQYVDVQRICTPVVPPHVSLDDAFPPTLPPGCETTARGTFICS